jgi:cytochrome b subunit of formate dehydrogenase
VEPKESDNEDMEDVQDMGITPVVLKNDIEWIKSILEQINEKIDVQNQKINDHSNKLATLKGVGIVVSILISGAIAYIGLMLRL